ncbi:MAG TPA: dihydroorotate dehydrogenase electron transfer subunit [Gammaproteobacteria bacterium]|nr:dihydroorotate dehydrogenase electron transfer subunit [Gammaproteobacteria bacterium]
MNDRPHRDTIFLEEARILTHQACAGEQYVLRLESPECATHAIAGQFVHLRCDPLLPMRRPISIMRADARGGWIELLYKVVGRGTALLAQRTPGEVLSLLGPIGRPFRPSPEKTRPLLLGGGVGMPPMVFLAEQMNREDLHPLVLLGSEVPFPFDPRPSRMLVPGIPDGAIGTMPLLEDLGIPCRLASQQQRPGCYQGFVTELARCWLEALDADQRSRVEIFACGPHPMLAAVSALARDYGLPCQVSLEEFMACAVGGCAGCVVEVQTASGPAMKRVCVDGPVFDAAAVFRP